MFTVKRPPLVQYLSPAGAPRQQKLRARRPTAQALLVQLQTAVVQFEQAQLDPLLDRAVARWAGTFGVEWRQPVQAVDTLPPVTPTPEAKLLNRGLYISLGAFGLAVAGNLFFPPLRLLSLVGLLGSSIPLYKQAYQALFKARTVNLDVLSALVNIAYIGGGWLVWGSMANLSYYFSFRLLLTVQARFAQALVNAFTIQARSVWLSIDGQMVQRELDAVQIGDILVAQAGDVIPVDGIISSGLALVDEQTLTGEARPVEKGPTAHVFATTLLLTGKLYITVQKTGAETTAAQIGQLLKDSLDPRTKRQLQAYQWSERLVLPVLGASAVTLPFLGPFSAAAVIAIHPQRTLNNLSTLGLLNFLLIAMQQGILIKDGRSLELLGEVDTVIFDKTGTLTQTQPRVAAIHPCAEIGAADLLVYAATAEQQQTHPLAHAILAAAQERGLVLLPTAETAYTVGYGVMAQIGAQVVYVGSARFMEAEQIIIPPAMQQVQAVGTQAGHSLVFVALDRRLVGLLELQSSVRPEAKALIATLRTQTQLQSLIIISGDQVAPTAQVAAEVGITDYFAEVLPGDKAKLIAQLQAAGHKVCFIGDGINDALALKQADVSISWQGATSAATDTAHIVFMTEGLHQIPALFNLVQAFETNQRNTMIALIAPGVMGLLGIFFLGFGLPFMAFLDWVEFTLGTTITMRPWLRQRRLLGNQSAAN